MFKGRWLFLIAIGGLAYAQDAPVVLLNDAILVCDETGCRERLNKETDQQGNGAREQQGAAGEGNASEPAPQTTIIYTPSPDLPSKRAEERAEDDLDAQEAMADWAQAMFWATLAGVVLIGFTLRESWRAATLAAQTLDQTKTANNVLQATAEIENRPWLFVENIGVTRLELNEGHDPPIVEVGLTFHLKNYGNSPAIGAECYLQGWIYALSPEKPHSETIVKEHLETPWRGRFTIPPQGHVEHKPYVEVRVLKPAQDDAGHLDIHLTICVTYNGANPEGRYFTIQRFALSDEKAFAESPIALVYDEIKAGQATAKVIQWGMAEIDLQQTYRGQDGNYHLIDPAKGTIKF